MTPVDADALERLLNETQYDRKKSEFLLDGFRNGFSLEYQGPVDVKITSKNLKFRGVGNETILWNKVMKEVKLMRYARPFREIPFKDSFIQSPIGLVPKDGGSDTRLIFHLSHPWGTNQSVNFNTPKEKLKVKYPDFSKAVQLCIAAGRSCKLWHSDMRSAFRHFCILH